MKSISEIIGGAQGLLDISFELQSCFEETLNKQQKTFLQVLRIIEKNMPMLYRPYKVTGRKPYQYLPFLRGQLAKNFFQIPTTTMLIERLKADPNLRLLCGFNKVPGQASFSRTYDYFAQANIMPEIHNELTRATFKDKVVYHICRDSTAISAREKAEKKKKDKTPVNKPKKRGRPHGTAEKRKKQPTEMEMQISEDSSVSMERFNKNCVYGCKQNKNGNKTFWKGYKLHLDISDWGFPVTACITGANVQDRLLAIPMEKITEQKITFCYSLMDCGYDSMLLRSFIENRERVPIIDYQTRNNGSRPVLDPAKKERYKIRTTVERANSHLKDNLIPKAIYVKGHTKVSFVLFSAVICLAALKCLQCLS
jgi:hypothetical protein